MTTPLERVRKALESIERAEGPFHRDRLTHAENCMADMVKQAQAALAALREMEEQEPVAWAPAYTDSEFETVTDGLLFDGRQQQLLAFKTREECEPWAASGYAIVPLVRAP